MQQSVMVGMICGKGRLEHGVKQLMDA